MMYAYSVSTTHLIVVAIVAFAVVMSEQRALAQPGTVKSHQKISSTQGGFTGTLDDSYNFGVSVASLGDLDGDSVSDLAVGTAWDDDGGNRRGAVWILFLEGNPDFSKRAANDQDGTIGNACSYTRRQEYTRTANRPP